MSRLKELAENRKIPAFKKAWMESLKSGIPASELLDSIVTLNNNIEEENDLPRRLAEKAVLELESKGSEDLYEFVSGAAGVFEHSQTIATTLVEVLRDKFLIFEPLEIFISASGILSEKKSLKDSWKKLEGLLRYQKGNYVLHKDFGPGEILRISRSSFTVDFLRSRDHDMSVEAMLDSTSPISPNSLFVLKWKKPDEFRSLMEEGGENLLLLAFRDMASENSIKEINLLRLLEGSETKPRQMWKTLKEAASSSEGFMDMGDSIIPADSSSLLSQVEAVLAIPRMAMSEKTKTLTSLIKSASKAEESKLEQIFDKVVSQKDIEKGAVFEFAWLCSSKGRVKKFEERVSHLIETKAVRVQRAMGEIHSVPCKKLYMKQFFANSAEEREIWILLDKLPRTMREQAADHTLEFNPEVHERYVLQALSDPAETAHFMWALERAAKLDEYMEPGKIVSLALKNLLFAKSEMQRRICNVLMNKLRPELEQHISLLDTRRLETLTENLEESIGAQETGLVLLARRELSGRRTGGFTNIRKFWETDTIFCSRDGINKRIEEIEEIRTVQIPLAAKAIAEAASHGDLSENAEYTAALEKRDFLLEMLNRYRKQLKLMRPYPVGEVNTEMICPATRVIMEPMESGEDMRTLYIVGLMDANADKGFINYKAPLGAALLGLTKGDTVQLPGDKNSQWRITEITLMEEYM